ncbi:response regulator [Pontibacter sp. KCTC 32443]|uniref:response regulator n=1 Tax=Pontibacter TaxID=323449 RepID=UPI00164D972D|nr:MULTISPECIES: response regulator [Pontibacter]MBC5772715.1 response regulator [Pontibacter sp. KCTC 32443]
MKKIPSILLVDDDETTNYINKLIINRAAITDDLLIATNGKDAIELVRERFNSTGGKDYAGVPKLILLDINMPIMDGFGFLDTIKSEVCFKDPSMVVAVLTTSLNPQDIERVREAGVKEFVNKPLTKQSLENLIEKYFEKNSSVPEAGGADV